MNLVERAAKRLEELQRAGVAVPWNAGSDDAQSLAAGSDASSSASNDAATTSEAPGVQRLRTDNVVDLGTAANGAAASPLLSVAIDLARLAQMGYITPDAPRAQIADEFRVIKRPLLANATVAAGQTQVRRGNLIMVTSSLPGEGKTFVSVNLAMSIAMELDRRVLLIDADPSRPAVFDRFGLTPAPGLLDSLVDPSIDFSSLILNTNVDRLSLLPVGTANSNATELLASTAMQRVVEQLAARDPDRIVVFDGPPLLPSTESRVLATHMGQIVFVVEAAKTAQSAVTDALATIEACPVVMTMLNKSRGGIGNYGYYGSY